MIKNFLTLEIKRLISFIWYKLIFFKKNIKFGYANSIRLSNLGNFVTLSDFVTLRNVSIGSFTYISKNSSINNSQIGKFCSISENVLIGQGIHPTTFVSTHPIFYSKKKQAQVCLVDKNYFNEYKKVYIGNDVWIGSNVIICDGVSIGDGAIIGAGSVIRKNVNPYEIIIGNPSKVIKKRFSKRIIKKLLSNPWWEWDTDKIFKNAAKFRNVEIFLKERS